MNRTPKTVANLDPAPTDASGRAGAVLPRRPPPRWFSGGGGGRGLPLGRGQPSAVGRFFRPREAAARARVTAIIEEVLRGDGLPVLGWREVPVRGDVLGAGARATCPIIRQVLIGPAADRRGDAAAWERALYLARKTIDARVSEPGPEVA